MIRSISIGSARYLTDPVSEDWIFYHEGLEERGAFMLTPIFANPVDTLQATLSQAGRFEPKGMETLDGVSVRHLTWRAKFEEYPRRAMTREVDVFIGEKDSLVRKLFIHDSWRQAPCGSGACPDILVVPGSSTYTLEFSFPGDEAPIVAPPVDRDIVSSAVGPMALFKNLHVPFSIRYPAEWKPQVPFFFNFFTWQEVVFQDDESPNPFDGHAQIRTRFIGDVGVKERYYACFTAVSHESGDSCTVAKRVHSRLAAGTFQAADYNDLLLADGPISERPSRLGLGGGSGWSAEVLEWTSRIDQGETDYLHTRQLTHVHETPAERPECAAEGALCYAVIEVRYTWTDDSRPTRAMADYSFSTLEWIGLTLRKGGLPP